MEAELAALAASGATTLVGLMVSETWTQTRDRLARFFARGGGDAEAVEAELLASRGELLAAREARDEDAAADIEDAWRTRLRLALLSDPGAAAELRSLLAQIAPEGKGAHAGTVHNSITGGTQHGPVLQGQQFTGLTFHVRAPRGAEGDLGEE